MTKIGCETHGAYFRLDSEKADRPGVFTNKIVALEGVEVPTDAKVCPAEQCSKPMVRLPDDAPTAGAEPQP